MMAFMPLLRNWLNTLAATRIVTARLWLRRSIVWTVVAAFLVSAIIAGLGFIAVGGFLSLRVAYSPWEAGLIVGGTLLLIALVGALVAWILFQRRPKLGPPLNTPSVRAAAASAATAAADHTTASPPPPGITEPGVASLIQLGEQLGDTVRGFGIRKKDILVGALVVGVVLGGSPELRRRVFSFGRRRDEYGRSSPTRDRNTQYY